MTRRRAATRAALNFVKNDRTSTIARLVKSLAAQRLKSAALAVTRCGGELMRLEFLFSCRISACALCFIYPSLPLTNVPPNGVALHCGGLPTMDLRPPRRR